jgi:hypothetical protein
MAALCSLPFWGALQLISRAAWLSDNSNQIIFLQLEELESGEGGFSGDDLEKDGNCSYYSLF